MGRVSLRLWLLALAIGVASLVACGSDRAVSDADRPEDGASAVVEDSAAGEDDVGDVLLVVAGDEFDDLAVIDPATGERTPIPVPVELVAGRPHRAIVGSTGDHVLIEHSDGALLWDRSMNTTEFLGFGARIRAIAPGPDPIALLVETNRSMLLVDLERGRAHDLTAHMAGWPEGVGPHLAAAANHEVAVVRGPAGGAIVIDLDRGEMLRHGDDLLFYSPGLSASGATLVAGRRSENGAVIVGMDAFDPSSATTWYEPEDRFAQVTVEWIGDRLIAVDFSGLVIDITGGANAEIVQMDPGVDDRPVTMRIHADRSLRDRALLEDLGSERNRWFLLDVANGTVDELGDLDGHELVRDAPPGFGLFGVGSFAEGFTDIRLIDLADGSVVVLGESGFGPAMSARAHPGPVVEIVERPRPHRSVFYSASGERIGSVRNGSSLKVDSQVSVAAHQERFGDDRYRTRIVPIDGSTRDEFLEDVAPLAWLPSR